MRQETKPNENRKLFAFILYLINLITVFTVIGFVSENPFLNIVLALYILIYSSTYAYQRTKKKKEKGDPVDKQNKHS